jgi:hypothetical protein
MAERQGTFGLGPSAEENFLSPPPTGGKWKYTGRSLWIVDKENPRNKIEIQTVPENLSYSFENKLNPIFSPGRNNPFYHYTGSEDTLEFEVSWYSIEESREDVITKCKWLEGMSKNDAYKGRPRTVLLDWHSSFKAQPNSNVLENKQLFQEAVWLIKAAPYQLSLFHQSKNMLPCLAKQQITLVRVANINRQRSTISDLRY